MNLSSLSSSALKSLIGLAEKREALVEELAKAETAISSVFSGGAVATPVAEKKANKRGPKKGSTRKPRKGKRGALKESLIAEFTAAGKAGVGVKEVAAKLGVKSQNIHVWIHTTGKKLGVKRLGPGKYAL